MRLDPAHLDGQHHQQDQADGQGDARRQALQLDLQGPLLQLALALDGNLSEQGDWRGRIASGQHLVYEKDSPLSNLYVSMLDAFGTPQEKFADSTGPLPGVLAPA